MVRLTYAAGAAQDFFTRTLSGGVITVVASVCMLLLFISELWLYMSVQPQTELLVDTSTGEQMQINVRSLLTLPSPSRRFASRPPPLPPPTRRPPSAPWHTARGLTEEADEKINVTFHEMPCAAMSLDVMDASGQTELDVDHDFYKQRLRGGEPVHEVMTERVEATAGTASPKQNGKECGSCYGAGNAGQCCNTCQEVTDAYSRKGWSLSQIQSIEQCDREGVNSKVVEQMGEGCMFYGHIMVNKVSGNFHFAPGRSFNQGHMHVHDIASLPDLRFNMSHTVNRLSFGEDFPGVVNPLDRVSKVSSRDDFRPGLIDHTSMFQYFLKVVPTSYTSLSGRRILTNQFSVTENERILAQSSGNGLPGVFFFYDISPLKVIYNEENVSFLHFLTSVCAIVGGVFTVSGIVDSFVYHGHRALKKKIELGKFS